MHQFGVVCYLLVWGLEGSVGALTEHRVSSPWTQGNCLFHGNIDVCSPVALESPPANTLKIKFLDVNWVESNL